MQWQGGCGKHAIGKCDAGSMQWQGGCGKHAMARGKCLHELSFVEGPKRLPERRGELQVEVRSCVAWVDNQECNEQFLRRGCSGCILLHAATRCCTLLSLLCAAVRCGTALHAATRCCTLFYAATRCDTLRHAAAQRCTLRHSAARCDTLLLHPPAVLAASRPATPAPTAYG
jgi:hypothetical protein